MERPLEYRYRATMSISREQGGFLEDLKFLLAVITLASGLVAQYVFFLGGVKNVHQEAGVTTGLLICTIMCWLPNNYCRRQKQHSDGICCLRVQLDICQWQQSRQAKCKAHPLFLCEIEHVMKSIGKHRNAICVYRTFATSVQNVNNFLASANSANKACARP